MSNCYQDYFTVNLNIASDGTGINTAYPSVKLMDSYTSVRALALMGFLFSGVVRNESGLSTGFWLILNNKAATAKIVQDANILAGAITTVNSNTANLFFNPLVVNTPVFYPPGFGMRLPAGTSIGAYAAAANAATDYIAATITLYFIYTK